MLQIVASPVAATLTLFLALVAIASALNKLGSRARTLRATQTLTVMSPRLAALLWGAALMVEISSAAGLLRAPSRQGAAALLTGLWLSYSLVLAMAHFGKTVVVDCGCSFGPRPKAPAAALGSALVLATLGAILVMASGHLPIVFGTLSLLPAVTLLLLYFLVDQLLSQSRGFSA
ncbi:MAG: hypothetical protein JWR80_2235 [Bradyrhizobium sp.]|nr:hypothetical protein [Bradyrhizobium sp.]